MTARFLVWLAVGCGRIGFDAAGDAAIGGDGISDDGNDAAQSAITVVQVAPPAIALGSNTATIQFPAPPTPGSMIIASAWTYDNGATGLDVTSVTDDQSNPYTIAAFLGGVCSAGVGAVALYYAQPATSSVPLRLRVTALGAASQEVVFVAIEATGITGLESTAMYTTPASSSPQTLASGTVATTGPALIAAAVDACSGSPNVLTWTDPSDLTARAIESDTQTTPPGFAGDRIAPAATSYEATWTITYTGTNSVGLAVIAAFQ